jgi:quinate/shikimate dehydrogenase (NAD+)
MASRYPESILLGLIGAPIAHSASPAMHEAAAKAIGLRCFYHLIEVEGVDTRRLRVMLDGLVALKFAGVNVTYPYKEAVASLLDALAPSAAAVGAVNLIAVRDDRLIGHNTDCSGFGRALKRTVGAIEGQRVALIGAGGVGKAIGAALSKAGAGEIRIVDRAPGKAAALAEALAPAVTARACASARDALDGAEGLVNATAVGMLPSRESPIPPALLKPGLWVADAVYQPLWTPLLLAARDNGATVMTGRELALDQAVEAFEIFTGRVADRRMMEKAFDHVVGRREAALA